MDPLTLDAAATSPSCCPVPGPCSTPCTEPVGFQPFLTLPSSRRRHAGGASFIRDWSCRSGDFWLGFELYLNTLHHRHRLGNVLDITLTFPGAEADGMISCDCTFIHCPQVSAVHVGPIHSPLSKVWFPQFIGPRVYFGGRA